MVAAAALLVFGLWAAYPRRPNLAAFNPDTVARVDAATWRDYYDKRYLALFGHLYQLFAREYGYSPLDSLRIALAAAQAAKTFQPTTSRAAAAATRNCSAYATFGGIVSTCA